MVGITQGTSASRRKLSLLRLQTDIAKAQDPKHPRYPKGSPHGGEFKPTGGHAGDNWWETGDDIPSDHLANLLGHGPWSKKAPKEPYHSKPRTAEAMLHPHTDDKGNPVFVQKPTPPGDLAAWSDPRSVATVTPGGKLPPALHGVPFKAWTPPSDWTKVEGTNEALEADLPPLKGWGNPGAGVIVEEPDGRIWLTRPTNSFGGYEHTFPKGTQEKGLTLQQTAVKEAWEETGLKVEIVGVLGDFKRTTSTARYYIARRVGGTPANMGWESQALRLVPRHKMKSFFSKAVDHDIADVLEEDQWLGKSRDRVTFLGDEFDGLVGEFERVEALIAKYAKGADGDGDGETEGRRGNKKTGSRLSRWGQPTSVMFEVAPDPNDQRLTTRWNSLDDATKADISKEVAADIVPVALKQLGADGELAEQVGGYMGATNPSLALEIDPKHAVDAAKLLGDALAQDSMMVVSAKPAPGLEPIGLIAIELPPNAHDMGKIKEIYDKLYTLTDNSGTPLVGGFTASHGRMEILNYSGLKDEKLAGLVDEALEGAYTVRHTTAYSSFVTKDQYGSGGLEGRSSVRGQGADSLRAAATAALERHLRTRSAQGRGRPLLKGRLEAREIEARLSRLEQRRCGACSPHKACARHEIAKAFDPTQHPRWPKGTPLAGKFMEVDEHGLPLPPTIGSAGNPEHAKKAQAMYGAAKAGDIGALHTLLQKPQAHFAKLGGSKINHVAGDTTVFYPDGKLSSQQKWQLQLHQYGQALVDMKGQVAQVAAKVEGMRGPPSLSTYKKVGGSLGGSNPAGQYEKNGEKFYVKGSAATKGGGPLEETGHRAKNEVLASKLMQTAGAGVADMHLVKDLPAEMGGGLGVASKFVDGSPLSSSPGPAAKDAIQKDFAVHAWLANYDVVGPDFANTKMVDGKAVNIDPGGALLFRAQGAVKYPGKPFGEMPAEVGEWISLRDQFVNPATAKVYGSMTASQLKDSATKLQTMDNVTIVKLVDAYGPGDNTAKVNLAASLIARRDNILAKVGLASPGAGKPSEAMAAPDPAPAAPVRATKAPAADLPEASLNALLTMPMVGSTAYNYAEKMAAAKTVEELEAHHAAAAKDKAVTTDEWGILGGGFYEKIKATLPPKGAAPAASGFDPSKGDPFGSNSTVPATVAAAQKLHALITALPADEAATLMGGVANLKSGIKAAIAGKDEIAKADISNGVGVIGGIKTNSVNSLGKAKEAYLTYAAGIAHDLEFLPGSVGIGATAHTAYLNLAEEVKTGKKPGGQKGIDGDKDGVFNEGDKKAEPKPPTAAEFSAATGQGMGSMWAKITDELAAAGPGSSLWEKYKGIWSDTSKFGAADMAAPNLGLDWMNAVEAHAAGNIAPVDNLGALETKAVQAIDAMSLQLNQKPLKEAMVDIGAVADGNVSAGHIAAVKDQIALFKPNADPGSVLGQAKSAVLAYADAVHAHAAVMPKIADATELPFEGSKGLIEASKMVQQHIDSLASKGELAGLKNLHQSVLNSVEHNPDAHAKANAALLAGYAQAKLKQVQGAADDALLAELNAKPGLHGVPFPTAEELGVPQGAHADDWEGYLKNTVAPSFGTPGWAEAKQTARGLMTNGMTHISAPNTAVYHWMQAVDAAHAGATGEAPPPPPAPTYGAPTDTYYGKLTDKLISAYKAGDLKAVEGMHLKADGVSSAIGKLDMDGKPKTANGQIFVAYQQHLAEALGPVSNEAKVAQVEAALNLKVFDVAGAGEAKPGLPAMPDFDAKLIDPKNTNAKYHNGKVISIQSAAQTGDVQRILALQFGTNTYAKKQVALANDTLAALGVPYTVALGQKPNSHPVLTGGLGADGAAAAMANAGKPFDPAAVAPTKAKIIPKLSAENMPAVIDFVNAKGPGQGLSSKPHVNEQNQALTEKIKKLALAGDLEGVKAMTFGEVNKDTGAATGVILPISKHPSSQIKNFHAAVVDQMTEIANPPDPLKVFEAQKAAASVAEVVKQFPPKMVGIHPSKVASNEKVGFWVALGQVSGYEKLLPATQSKLTTAAINQAKADWAKMSGAAKEFASSVQGGGGTAPYKQGFDALLPNGEINPQSKHLIDRAKAAHEYARIQPPGTTIWRVQHTPSDMMHKLATAKPGLVIQNPAPSCASYMKDNQSAYNVNGGGNHYLEIIYAPGAKAMNSFGSGSYGNEKEVTTLPNARFIVVKHVAKGDNKWGLPQTTLLMLPPDPYLDGDKLGQKGVHHIG